MTLGNLDQLIEEYSGSSESEHKTIGDVAGVRLAEVRRRFHSQQALRSDW